MTLNRVIALILRFFSPKSIALQADYATVVQDRPIMSVSPSSSLPLLAKTNAPCSAVSLGLVEHLVLKQEHLVLKQDAQLSQRDSAAGCISFRQK